MLKRHGMGGLLAKNTTAQIVAKAVSVATAIVLIRLTTENLGKDGYGVYSFVMSLVLLFGTISDWGTSIIAVREASQNRDKQKEIFSTTFILQFVLSLVAVALLNIVVRTYQPWYEFTAPLTVGSLVLLFLSIKSSMSVVFQALLKFELSAAVEIINSLVFFVLAVFLLTRGGGVVEVLSAWVIGTAVAALVAFFLAVRIAKLSLSISSQALGRLVKESLPMGLFLLFFSIYNRIDIIILQHFQSIGDVAVYNLAYRIHDNLVLGAAFLMGAAFPILSGMMGENRKVFYQRIFGVIALGGLVVSLIFFLAAPLVINFLTGEEFGQFSDSVIALKILVFATFVSYINHLTGYSLIAFGKQKEVMVMAIFALIFNIVANLIFIPTYSWQAAALITVLTETLVFVLSVFVVRKNIGVLPDPRLILKTLRDIFVFRGNIFKDENH